MKQSKQKILIWTSGFALAGVLLLFIPLWKIFGPVQFDRSKWIASAREINTPTTRQRMLNDIQYRILQAGMSRSEIIGTLGDPDTDTFFTSYDLVYVLGPERGLISIDNEWLCINLDDQGLFGSAEIRTD